MSGGAFQISAFGRLKCLHGLDPEVVQAVANRAQRRTFRAGETIIDTAEAERDLYILVGGRVRVADLSPRGRELTFQLLDSGEMFGEISAIDGARRTARVVAETDVVVAALSRSDFFTLAREWPDFGINVLQRMARLARHLTWQVTLHRRYKVRGRVIAEYLRLDAEHDGPFKVPDRDVGSRVGATHNHVANLRRQLVQDGLLAWNNREISVLDRAPLEALLEEQELS